MKPFILLLILSVAIPAFAEDKTIPLGSVGTPIPRPTNPTPKGHRAPAQNPFCILSDNQNLEVFGLFSDYIYISVADSSETTVYETVCTDGENHTVLPELPNGVYTISVSTDESSFAGEFQIY